MSRLLTIILLLSVTGKYLLTASEVHRGDVDDCAHQPEADTEHSDPSLSQCRSSSRTETRHRIGSGLELSVSSNHVTLTILGRRRQEQNAAETGNNPPTISLNGTLGLARHDDHDRRRVSASFVVVSDDDDDHDNDSRSLKVNVTLSAGEVQYSSGTLEVSSDASHHDDEHGVDCYTVEWLIARTDSSLERRASTAGVADCFSLAWATGGKGHWYGGPEVLEQRWPIDRQRSSMQHHVTGDFLTPKWRRAPTYGKFGPIVEPYWVTSTGVSVFVEQTSGHEFNSGFNENGDGRLCVGAATLSSESSTMTIRYHICSGQNILDVHRYSSAKFFGRPSGVPDVEIMRKPIWSTWARYKVGVNQTAVEELAREIHEYGFQCSQLEIDDRYSSDYGQFDFDTVKFPNASAMIAKLHVDGHRVSAWVTPFANLHSQAMAEGAAGKYWIADGDFADEYVPALTRWWQGVGAVLDVSNPDAVTWYVDRLRLFQRQHDIDSFKFDSGEVGFLPRRGRMKTASGLNDFTTLYAKMAAEFGAAIEIRSAYRKQDLPVFVRMLDKDSVWGHDNGLRSIIPTALLFGLVGYPFVLPDMIGGNGYSPDDIVGLSSTITSSLKETVLPDRELYIRWTELSAFLPAMQFSVVPWQYDEETVTIARKFAVDVRQSLVNHVIELFANKSASTGDPIIRPLWWIDPNDEDSLSCDSEFLIGDRLLVAPVLEAGARARDVYLPGKNVQWKKYAGSEISIGRIWIRNLRVELDEIAVFERVD